MNRQITKEPKPMDFEKKLLSIIDKAIKSGESVDLLPFARSLPQFLLDLAIQGDYQVKIFSHNDIVQCIALDKYGKPAEYEPYYVHFLIPFKVIQDGVTYNHGIDYKTQLGPLLMAISSIMLADCTGCCDALSAMWVNSQGIYAYGDVSMTYHS